MPSSPARSPSAQNTTRNGTAHENSPSPFLCRSLLSALCEMRLILPLLEKSAREAVLDAARDSTRHPMQSRVHATFLNQEDHRLTHSLAPACRENDPYAGPKAFNSFCQECERWMLQSEVRRLQICLHFATCPSHPCIRQCRCRAGGWHETKPTLVSWPVRRDSEDRSPSRTLMSIED
jgi:hypothetical protein